jgi:hypothetical protein
LWKVGARLALAPLQCTRGQSSDQRLGILVGIFVSGSEVAERATAQAAAVARASSAKNRLSV